MFDMETNRNYGVGLGSLALINAGLAESKGRGRLNWFLLSLFLGPIATLYIVSTDAVPKPAPKEP